MKELLRLYSIVSLLISSQNIWSQTTILEEGEYDNLIEILDGIQPETFQYQLDERIKKGGVIVDSREKVDNKTDFLKKIIYDKSPESNYVKLDIGSYQIESIIYLDAEKLRVEWWWKVGLLKYSDHITTKAKITAKLYVNIKIAKDKLIVSSDSKYSWRKKPTSNFHGIKLDLATLLKGEVNKQLKEIVTKQQSEINKIIKTFKG